MVTVAAVVLMSVSALASSPAPLKVGDNYCGVKRLTVGIRTRVTWRLAGVRNHNVTVSSGPSKFHSRTQAVGSFSHVFTKPGTYSLYCTIHRQMKMAVVVR